MNETGDVFVDMINIMAKYGAEFPLSLTMYGRSLLVMEGTVSNLDEKTDLTDILGRHLAAYAIGDGPAGRIARKLSHNRLCSGSRLHYNEYQTKEEVPKDSELLSEEEYRILSETGAKVWSPENE
jgi:predicted unusual protein kinase regulating ubiquinone biosynthesis (AarF/ABC1/UbiB family)